MYFVKYSKSLRYLIEVNSRMYGSVDANCPVHMIVWGDCRKVGNRYRLVLYARTLVKVNRIHDGVDIELAHPEDVPQRAAAHDLMKVWREEDWSVLGRPFNGYPHDQKTGDCMSHRTSSAVPHWTPIPSQSMPRIQDLTPAAERFWRGAQPGEAFEVKL